MAGKHIIEMMTASKMMLLFVDMTRSFIQSTHLKHKTTEQNNCSKQSNKVEVIILALLIE